VAHSPSRPSALKSPACPNSPPHPLHLLLPPPLQKSRAGFASLPPTFLATHRRVTPSLHRLRSRASAHRSSLSRPRHCTRSRLRFRQGTAESTGSSSSARHGRARRSSAPREPWPPRLYCFLSLRHWLRFGTAKCKPHSLGSLRPLSAAEPPCNGHRAPLSPASTIVTSRMLRNN
jgi:hypothetical protein